MAIVTLTTDFGHGGYELARLRGAVLKESAELQLVDITHTVNNYDIVQAAFIFRNAWASFPKGAIHLISINDYAVENPRFLVTAHHGHYFVAPDNGLFTLIFGDDQPRAFHELKYSRDRLLNLEEVYAYAAGFLARGRPIIEIGPPVADIMQRITLQPVISHSQIRGSVIFVDNYENAITNVSKTLFEQVGGGRDFQLFFKRHDPICELSQYYNEVEVGEPLCLFNSAGLLEVAINMGRAGSLLSLKVEDTVQIDFHS
jgi:S-adenosyl-L-methionine hydrolase (adenosine-forming)